MPRGAGQHRSDIMRSIGQQPGEPGRGLIYDPEFCRRIMALAALGKLPEQWCADIGVTMSCFYVWTKEHPEFDEAWRIAWHIATAYWTEQIMAHIANPNAKTALILEIARKRFPSTWGKNPINTAEGFDLLRQAEAAQGEGTTDLGGVLVSAEERHRRIAELAARFEAAKEGKDA